MPYFTDTAAEKSAPQPTTQETPLAAQYNQHIFRIITQSGTGTGFRATDGRIVTNMRLIEGGGQIYAEQDGKRFQLGKNVMLDDINEIAVLDFVDTKPPSSSGLRLAGQPPETSATVLIAGYQEGSRHQVSGNFIRQIAQEEYRGTFGSQTIGGPLSVDRLRDATEFARRPLLELHPKSTTFGMVGSPIISRGQAIGIKTELQNSSSTFAIPAEKVQALLEQSPADAKFSMSGRYESGLQKYYTDWSRSPGTAVADSLFPAGQVGALVMSGGKSSNVFAPAFLGFSAGMLAIQDSAGFLKSTNDLDTRYFGVALAADSVTLSGAAMLFRSLCVPKLRPLALGVSMLGLTGRLGCELIPNKYVLQPPTRTDGTPRRPFHTNQ